MGIKPNWITFLTLTVAAVTWASLSWAGDDDTVACYYGGADGHQRICEGDQAPTTAYCSDTRTTDCCDSSIAEWVAKKTAHYQFVDASRSDDRQSAALTVWECQLKAGKTQKNFYRPVDATDSKKSQDFYARVNKLGASPRFTLSDLGTTPVKTGNGDGGPTDDPVVPSTPTTPSTPTVPTVPSGSARKTDDLLNLNPGVAGVRLMTDEEKKALSKSDQGCGFVDLREKGLPPMRNAQLTGWTFANTAADLIEFSNRKQVADAAKAQGAKNTEGSVSPTDLTLGYYQIARTGINGAPGLTREQFLKFRKTPDAAVGKGGVGLSDLVEGTTLGVLNAYRAHGSKACLEKNSPAEDFPQVSCDGAESKKLDFRDLVGCLDRMVTQLCSANLQGPELQAAQKQAVQKNETVLKSLFPGVSFDDFQSTLGEAMKQGDPALAFIENLHQKACSSPIALSQSEYLGFPSAQNRQPKAEDFQTAIDQALDAGLPVSTGLRRDVILNPGLASIEAPGLSIADWGAQAQAVLTVGRRWNPSGAGQCEYLVRPNLGTECSSIFRVEAKKFCQDGYVWVAASQIKGAVKEVAYVKP